MPFNTEQYISLYTPGCVEKTDNDLYENTKFISVL